MLLYDIKTKQIVEDAEEQKTKIKNLSIWHHSEGKPIAFSTDLEEKGYKLLSEDAPEIIKARYEKEKELKSKLSKERNEKDKEALRMKEAEEQRIKVEMARELYLKTIIPKGNQMPIWFNKYAQSLQINKGKQDRIRQTYTYSKREWIDYFASSFPSTFLAGYKIVSNLLENKIINEKYAKKTTIKIADIGCGSGGATIGTITAINQLLPNIENIELDAYDYSKDALAIFANCLNAYPNQKFNKLKLSQEVKFVPKHSDEDPNMYTFEEFEKKLLSNKNYDFILCFKISSDALT